MAGSVLLIFQERNKVDVLLVSIIGPVLLSLYKDIPNSYYALYKYVCKSYKNWPKRDEKFVVPVKIDLHSKS